MVGPRKEGYVFEGGEGFHPQDELRKRELFNHQIRSFLYPLMEANVSKPKSEQRLPGEYEYMVDYFERYVEDRNKRAAEIKTSDHSAMVALAGAIIPQPLYEVLCMDGRVLGTLENGFSAKMVPSMRLPGAEISDFVIGVKQKLKLLEKSDFAKSLDRALAKNWRIFQKIDSHFVCAARIGKEEKRSVDAPEDFGLWRDVIEKRHMGRAMVDYAHSKYGDARQIVPIQVSYDPHTGFSYMGLETKKANDYAKARARGKARNLGEDPDKAEPEFTQDVLEKLVEDDGIIYTKELVNRPEILEAFKRHFFVIDWKNDYLGSERGFWRGIANMTFLIPLIEEDILKIYPHLSSGRSADELSERAMLLLTSAFSGYLLNKGNLDEENHEFEYAEHREEGVEITEGGNGPYNVSTFEVSSLDPNIAINTDTAVGLIKKNRKAKRVTDPTKNLYNSEFVRAMVPLAVVEIIRGEEELGEAYNVLRKIDWSDLPSNWDELSTKDFYEYIDEKSIRGALVIPTTLTTAINKLRIRMASLYDKTHIASRALLKQEIIAMPVIQSQDREVLGVIPFLKIGF